MAHNQDQIIVYSESLLFDDQKMRVRVGAGKWGSRISGSIWKEKDGTFTQSFLARITDGDRFAFAGEIQILCSARKTKKGYMLGWSFQTQGTGAYSRSSEYFDWYLGAENGAPLTPKFASGGPFACSKFETHDTGSATVVVDDIRSIRTLRVQWSTQYWDDFCTASLGDYPTLDIE